MSESSLSLGPTSHPQSIIEIVQGHALSSFMFDLGRYLIAAALIAGLVWLLRRTRWAARKIQAREATGADFRREFGAALQTIGVYSVVTVFVVWCIQNGYLQPIKGSYGLATDLALLAGIIVAHDAYFYWAHRAMHHPRLFKSFHRFHHRTITPTAWAAYSFALPEAVVMAVFVPAWQFLFPTPGWVMFSFLAIMILRNCMGHAGLELHPRGWASHPVLKWISTTTHHDMHHAGSFNHNFGFYFTFWDKVMGTEHADYVATFDRVTTRSTAPVASQRTKTSDAAPSPAL